MTESVSSIAAVACDSMQLVCRVLSVARSSLYELKNRKLSKCDKDSKKLDVDSKAEFKAHKGRYGSPRIHRELRTKGRPVSRKRAAARMKAKGIATRRSKRFRRTTESAKGAKADPNIPARRFDWERPNPAWCGDITYIWTGTEGLPGHHHRPLHSSDRRMVGEPLLRHQP